MKKEITMAVVAIITASSALAVLKQDDAVKMDTDQDGKVSRAEYASFFTPSFARKDQNKDGMLTPDEFTSQGAFKSGDLNKDSQLTVEEYGTVFEKQFDNIHDKNKDGVLDGEEIQ